MYFKRFFLEFLLSLRFEYDLVQICFLPQAHLQPEDVRGEVPVLRPGSGQRDACR